MYQNPQVGGNSERIKTGLELRLRTCGLPVDSLWIPCEFPVDSLWIPCANPVGNPVDARPRHFKLLK